MSYPWTQGHYWWRSLFPTWSDWYIKVRASSVLSSGWHLQLIRYLTESHKAKNPLYLLGHTVGFDLRWALGRYSAQ